MVGLLRCKGKCIYHLHVQLISSRASFKNKKLAPISRGQTRQFAGVLPKVRIVMVRMKTLSRCFNVRTCGSGVLSDDLSCFACGTKRENMFDEWVIKLIYESPSDPRYPVIPVSILARKSWIYIHKPGWCVFCCRKFRAGMVSRCPLPMALPFLVKF